MRIVIDARYVRPRPSGIRFYLEAVLKRLPALAPEDTLRLWTDPEAPDSLPRAPNVQIHRVPAPANSVRTLLVPGWLDGLRIDDVFHAPANILGRGLPCPSVVTVHDLMWLQHPELCEPNMYLRWFRAPFFGSGIRLALSQAARILTVSRASADAIVRATPAMASKVRVTSNACETCFQPATDTGRARADAANILDTDAPYFLVVGKNQPSKGHETVLRAFAAQAGSATRLVLVQQRNVGASLESLAHALGLAGRIHWLSTRTQKELITLLQGAVALLQPSHAEGFGMPALEAISCGCPVIAGDIPPLREVVGSGGLYIRPGDAEQLAREMTRLAEEPSLRGELREQGLEHAKRFDWDDTARLTLESYREAAQDRVDLGRCEPVSSVTSLP